MYPTHTQFITQLLHRQITPGDVFLHILDGVLHQFLVHGSNGNLARLGVNTRLYLVSPVSTTQFYQFSHTQYQYLHHERFRHVVVRTDGQSLHFVFHSLLGCKQYHRDDTGTIIRLHQVTQLVTIHFGHHHVTDDDIRHQVWYHRPSLPAVGSRLHPEIQAQTFFHELN